MAADLIDRSFSKDSISPDILSDDGVLLDIADVAPSPSKDYFQIIVTTDEVIFRWWKVSIRSGGRTLMPGQLRESFADFLHNDQTHSQIQHVWGTSTLEYILGLAQGHLDYFPRLPQHLILKIISFVPLETIQRLALVSKLFHKLCHSDELWEELYLTYNGSSAVTDDLRSLAETVGWRTLFFTNKLRLQVQLRRYKSKKLVQIRPVHAGMERTAARAVMERTQNNTTDSIAGELSEELKAYIASTADYTSEDLRDKGDLSESSEHTTDEERTAIGGLEQMERLHVRGTSGHLEDSKPKELVAKALEYRGRERSGGGSVGAGDLEWCTW